MKEWVREKIRDVVFGAQDGLVSTLGAVSGVAAGSGEGRIVILAGFVVVAVESLSMAAGSYLSSKSNRQYLERLLEEERRSIEENPQHELKELYQMYRERGFTDEEIRVVARRLFQDKRLLLEDMAHKELGIFPGRMEEPISNAVAMGLSYICAGSIPVIPYLLLPVTAALPVSILATGAALFAFGAVKGRLVRRPWFLSGLEMFLVAWLACVIGLAVGMFFRGG